MNAAERRALTRFLTGLSEAARAGVRVSELPALLTALGEAIDEVNKELGRIRGNAELSLLEAMTRRSRWLREQTSELKRIAHQD